jgi:hypothetical protein
MSSPNLGQFLRAAHRRMTEAERFVAPDSATLDTASTQLARFTAVLPRYLKLTSASSSRQAWSGPAADMDIALTAAARSMARWTWSGSRSSERSPNQAEMIGAAADSLRAGYELLHTHLEDEPDTRRAARSWWGPVICSSQVTAAIFDELTTHATRDAPGRL